MISGFRGPRRPRTTPPRRGEILATLEYVEVGLSAMMRRWQDGAAPAEVRAEIMDIYRPMLLILIEARRTRHGNLRSASKRISSRRHELLGALARVEIALSDMMRRWQGDSIPAEARAEIATFTARR